MRSLHFPPIILILITILLTGCGSGEHQTNVQLGNAQQVLYVNNGAEPQDLDPDTITGMPEYYILLCLFEGLVSKDPKTLEPVPGVAESWNISDDQTHYVFHLRKNALWSNGDPVTAHDFYYSWKRLLSPKLGSEYSYMLYPVENAKAFNLGKISDFNEVGVKVIDDYTLAVNLKGPTPYFLQLLDHHSLFPVQQKTIEKFGEMDERGTRWTRPGNFVGNGPFRLKEWSPNKELVVEKNPTYWDAKSVRLNEVYFYPVDNKQTEERMFRTGQIHMTLDGQIQIDKIAVYQKEHPELIRIYPYLGTYYYLFNTKRKPFDDIRVRRAFSMAIDRKKLVEDVIKGGKLPANAMTPPDTAGYTPEASIGFNPEEARKLLAEAGYPDGRGFPHVELLYNTHENHQKIAVAIQQFWKQYLNVDVAPTNEEWKVYLEDRENLNYDIARAAWIGDYVDPNTFLELFITESGNNHTGWSNREYDRLIQESNVTLDRKKRMALFQKAEHILIDESPIAPIYFYTSVNLIRTDVKGVYQNLLTYYPFKYAYLANDKK